MRCGPIRLATEAMGQAGAACPARAEGPPATAVVAPAPRGAPPPGMVQRGVVGGLARACSTIACVEAMASTQPVLPHVHIRSVPPTGRVPDLARDAVGAPVHDVTADGTGPRRSRCRP